MNFKAILKGTALSLLLVIITLFISAVLVYFNILSEKTASIIVFAMAMIGVFLAALGVAKASERKLLVNALGVAFLFSLIVFISSVIVNNGIALHTRTLTLIGGSFTTAFLGAIFGK